MAETAQKFFLFLFFTSEDNILSKLHSANLKIYLTFFKIHLFIYKPKGNMEQKNWVHVKIKANI